VVGAPALDGALSSMRQLKSLEAWKVATDISRRAYRLTLDSRLRRQYGLIDQLRRAAASIPANIAEGYALGTTAQLIRALRISLGSSAELRSHLELLKSVELVEGEQVDRLERDVDRLIGLLVGLLKKLGARTPRPS
jgi:four helix bundle protein